ncbi:MAG: SDR family NAD(P)-dependent oxidoreductase [Promethearchaeota archaeon]|jgi:3-oxoacyl-[acyl-carrier protein] reductase
MRLKGKVALITGASRGIGHSMAKLFAQEGAKVAINFFKSEKEALDLAEEIRKQGGEAIAIKADVSNLNDIKKMIQTTMAKFGTIDILVNNAGIILSATFLDCTDEIWDKTMDVNLKGAFLCSKEVAPIMLEKKKGKIINISSASGLAERSAVGNTPYAVSKAGLIGLTRSLAVNLGPYVNVNAICPGLTETDMAASLKPERRRKPIEESIVKRIGKPKEIAHAALFLASDESDFITAEIMTVAGGRAIR